MKLAVFELRRFRRALLSRLALVILTLIPLLYGALYLYAFWDPYGNLKRVPVAMVVEDRPATAPDGSTVRAGRQLADELTDRQVFAWHRTTRAQADKGLADGTYHLVLRIPADFSASLASPLDSGREPRRGQLVVVSDDATNYLSGLLARSAFTEIRASASAGAARGYFDKMLVGFTDLKAQTARAADGAGRLADGTGQAANGAAQAAAGADAAADGAGTLAGGLDRATAGAGQLVTGLAALSAGAAQLADGTAQAAAGGRLLAGKVDGAADTIGPVLRDNAVLIGQAATAVADGADLVAANLSELPRLADRAVADTTAVRDQLNALAAAHPELARDPAFQAVRTAAADAVTVATTVRDRLNTAGLTALRAQLRQVAATARQVAAAAPHLADDVAAARAQVDRLAAGLDQLATGADRLHQGTSSASTGAPQLYGGLYRLSTGARQLDGGLAALSDGTHRLASGLSTLQVGATRLADGLADGARKIPGYDPDDRARRADVLGDPVSLDRTVHHKAATYGVGFAPYFLSLALWVGAMITYMLLRPLTRRYLMSGAPARRVALAGWLPGLVVGVVQAAVLYTVLRLALRLAPVHPWATLGYLLLTAAAFTALLQWLGARLGPAGRLVALAVLMLQLTSSGGTYPVQTTPRFFQVLHPWLPMTYVVDGLRHLIDGGGTGTVIRGGLVLAAFAAGAFALTTLAAHRSRRLTPAKLHPDLVM